MGVGILVPSDSPMGMILGGIALIFVVIFIILGIGAGISRLSNSIGNYFNDKERWYYKPNKDVKIAFFYSILLPFSGNVYLKESILSLILTLITIGLMALEMFDAINGNIHSFSSGTSLLSIWWFISLVSLIINIMLHDRHKNSFYENYSKRELDFIEGKKFLRIIPIILIILFLIANAGVISTDSVKSEHLSEHLFISSEHSVHGEDGDIYEEETKNLQNFSLKFPDDYKLGEYCNDLMYSAVDSHKYIATRFDNVNEAEGFVTLEIIPDYGESAKYYAKLNLNYLAGNTMINNTDGGTIKISGETAYIVKDMDGKWTKVLFKKNNDLYELQFFGNAQKDIDYFANSFKFT